MEITFSKFIFGVLPESFLIIYVGLGLLEVKLKIGDYIKIVFLTSFGLLFIRNILNIYGMHMFIYGLLMILTIKFFVEIDWKWILVAVLSSFTIVSLGEMVIYWGLKDILGLNIKEFFNTDNSFLFFGLVYLMELPLIIIASLIYFNDFKFYDVNSDKNARI